MRFWLILLTLLSSIAFAQTEVVPVIAVQPMKVRSITLSPEQKFWLTALKSSTNYASETSIYSLERLGGTGNVLDLSRHLNLQLEAVLAALRVTGDRELLEKVYAVMQAERATLRDHDGDKYLDWPYLPNAPTGTGLDGTDRHVMEEIMAHSIVAQAAWAFRQNRALDRKYINAGIFWTKYLVRHYEAKWRERTGKAVGYPIIEKPLMHPFSNSIQYAHYMHKLTGRDTYRVERERLMGVLTRQVMPDGGAVVWSHFVNEMLPSARRGWLLQPTGYTGETMSALADLGFEGVLDESTMHKVAGTVTINMLDGKGPGLMARSVGGEASDTYYSPFLLQNVEMKLPDYPRSTGFFFLSRGYGLLARWDSTGEIVRVASSLHRTHRDWPMPAVSALLGYR